MSSCACFIISECCAGISSFLSFKILSMSACTIQKRVSFSIGGGWVCYCLCLCGVLCCVALTPMPLHTHGALLLFLFCQHDEVLPFSSLSPQLTTFLQRFFTTLLTAYSKGMRRCTERHTDTHNHTDRQTHTQADTDTHTQTRKHTFTSPFWAATVEQRKLSWHWSGLPLTRT